MSTLFSYMNNAKPHIMTNNKNMKHYIVSAPKQEIIRLICPDRKVQLTYGKPRRVCDTVYRNLLANSTDHTPKPVIDSVNCYEGSIIQRVDDHTEQTQEHLSISRIHLYTLCNILLNNNIGLVIVKNDDLAIDIYDPPSLGHSFFSGTLDEYF